MRLNQNRNKLWFVIVAVLVVMTACGGPKNNGTTLDAGAAPAATNTNSTEAQQCTGGHVVLLDERKQNRYLSNGIQAVESEDMRQEVSQWLKHDPVGLFSYYNESPLGRQTPLKHVEALVEGGKVENGKCFSAEGRRAYARWLPLWETAVIEAVDQMPGGWANSGVSNGWPTSGPAPTGNTSGWMVSYVDAGGKVTVTHGVMKRCGNITSPNPTAPEGPTDNPSNPEGGKDHRRSPVSDDPNDPDEATRPNTAEPARPVPAPTHNPNPEGGAGPSDSGEGATATTVAPTTSTTPPAPPVTASPSVPVTSP